MILKKGFGFHFKSLTALFAYSAGVFPPKSENEDNFLFSTCHKKNTPP